MAQLGKLASIPALPSGGYGQSPEIDDVRVNTEPPFGNQIISENVQVRAVTVTPAQLLALKGADVLLANAPGAGYALALESVSFRLNFKTTAYTLNAGTLKIYLGASANGVVLTADQAAILTQGVTSDIVGAPALTSGVQTQANTENQGLYLANTGAAQFTAGDCTLDVVVAFITLQM